MADTWTQETGAVASTENALLNISEDLTPQLGGELDTNGQIIKSSNNSLVISGGNASTAFLKLEKGDPLVDSEYAYLRLSQNDIMLHSHGHLELEGGAQSNIRLTVVSSNNIRLMGIPVQNPGVKGAVFTSGAPPINGFQPLLISGGIPAP